MAFEVSDYLDLLRLLQEHPEWRAELRRLLLTDEVLTLPQLVRELVEAQRHTETHVAALAEAQRRLEEQMAALTEAQRRTDERVGRLEERVGQVEGRMGHVEERVGRLEERMSRVEEELAKLAEAQRRTQEELRALAAAQRLTEEALRALAESQRRLERRVDRLTDTVGSLKGRTLEQMYRDRASAYFGRLLRRLQVVDPYELEETLRVHLSEEEFADLLQLDLLIRGQPRRSPEIGELWLAVEISAVVDPNDVERAHRRATYLRRAGYRVIPMVVGERVMPTAEEKVRQRSVALMQEGSLSLWEEAWRAWVGP